MDGQLMDCRCSPYQYDCEHWIENLPRVDEFIGDIDNATVYIQVGPCMVDDGRRRVTAGDDG